MSIESDMAEIGEEIKDTEESSKRKVKKKFENLKLFEDLPALTTMNGRKIQII